MGIKESNKEGRYRRSKRRKFLERISGKVVLDPSDPNRSLFDVYNLPKPVDNFADFAELPFEQQSLKD